MTHGYAGKLLFVDLTSGTIQVEVPEEDVYRTYIGGTGLGAKILYDRTEAGIDPLGPGNMLGFVTGPLTATGVYGGGRFTVVAKSPLTNSWADSNSGGTWGPELRMAGYDAVFFSGASPRPVYLAIDGGTAELRDAAHLWGLDTYETDDRLQKELDDGRAWKISCIGPSGEDLSPLAGIVNEKGRIAARSGLGAVMGSKRLKAVAVRAAKGARIPVADREGLKAVQADYGQELKENGFMKGLTAAGTGGGTSFLLSIGDCPTRNWTTTGSDSLPTAPSLDGGNMDRYKVRAYGCHTCPVRCGALIEVKEGPYPTVEEMHRPEYETVAAFGPLCLNDDIESIIKANEICNRYGIDTISTGGIVGFAMECWEKGLIGPEDTDGIELAWGDAAAVVALTEKIARAEGFGALLAQGVKPAAERIGKGAEDLAIHVAGRGLPYHDPRLSPSSATFYIADAQPAQHMGRQAMGHLEQGRAVGQDPLLQPEEMEFFGDYDRRGDIYAKGAAYGQLLSSAGLCALYSIAMTPPLVELIRPVTGWDMDWEEGLRAGRRINTLRQAFNIREGVTPEDFKMPKRFETPIEIGPAAGKSIPYEDLRKTYFSAMGWDPETGVPDDATMAEFGLV